MNHQIAVYKSGPASVPVATWINNTIAPVLIAINAVGRPIELRPMRWAGLSAGCKHRNPDGRISLSSSRAQFWSAINFVSVYIHELSHCIFEKFDSGSRGHDAAFFSLNLTLLLRLDAIDYLASETLTEWSTGMSLYDLQEPPECFQGAPVHVWQPRAMAWAMVNARELSGSSASAESVAKEIALRYEKWCTDMADEPQRLANQAAQKRADARHLTTQILKFKNDLFLFKGLFAVAVLGIFAILYAAFRRSID